MIKYIIDFQSFKAYLKMYELLTFSNHGFEEVDKLFLTLPAQTHDTIVI